MAATRKTKADLEREIRQLKKDHRDELGEVLDQSRLNIDAANKRHELEVKSIRAELIQSKEQADKLQRKVNYLMEETARMAECCRNQSLIVERPLAIIQAAKRILPGSANDAEAKILDYLAELMEEVKLAGWGLNPPK